MTAIAMDMVQVVVVRIGTNYVKKMDSLILMSVQHVYTRMLLIQEILWT